jgi:hypothetical protein
MQLLFNGDLASALLVSTGILFSGLIIFLLGIFYGMRIVVNDLSRKI